MSGPFHAICEECSENVALVVPGSTTAICSTCLSYRSMETAAKEQLEGLAPLIGNWVSTWSAQGLSIERLAAVAEDVSYVGKFGCDSELLRASLRKLRVMYAMPSPDDVEEVTQRVQFDLQTLPLLTEFYFRNPEAKPTAGRPLPIFKDEVGESYRPPAGLSSVSFTLPDETQVYLFTDSQGRVTSELTCGPAGYRIARELKPIFEHYLRGPDHWEDLPRQTISK